MKKPFWVEPSANFYWIWVISKQHVNALRKKRRQTYLPVTDFYVLRALMIKGCLREMVDTNKQR
jgi:hypothetical protein